MKKIAKRKYINIAEGSRLTEKRKATLLDVKKDLDDILDTAEKTKNCYNWRGDNGNATARESREKQLYRNIDICLPWAGINQLTAEHSISQSRKNTYRSINVCLDGESRTMAIVRRIRDEIVHLLVEIGYLNDLDVANAAAE